jgi:2-C-methyl-D-erythritol 2,4-cyclodiphosphate synthase
MARGVNRFGIGYDAHPFAEGLSLVLGGVEIPHDRGLLGHSDADVLLHAVMDAMFGAAALGDLGVHFPDTDPQYAGISSLMLLERARAILEEAGYRAVQVDATLLAEAPRVSPYFETMRMHIATSLGIKSDMVSVKATTQEGLGWIGRREGIAAFSVVQIAPIAKRRARG